jgi:hypothetical protein
MLAFYVFFDTAYDTNISTMDRPSQLVMLPENIPTSILQQFGLNQEAVKQLSKNSAEYKLLEAAVLNYHIFGKNETN